MLQRWNQTTRRSKKPFRKSNNEKITDKVKMSKVKFRGHISCTEDASVWADSYFTTLFNEWMSVQSTNIWASTIWQTGAKIFTLCFTVPLCLRFHLLIRSPVASAPGKQGIMVVSHHHSMVLTYIDVGSVDAVYFIWHSWAAQQSWIDLVLSSEGSASGRHNPAGSAAKRAVTRVISGSMTPGKGPLPGTPSF